MRTRMLLTASAVALVAASCSQPEPHVLSEAPRATTSTDLTSTTETTTREAQPGRFVARCATEADGGTPGMTIFTDGSEGVTDHCLSRYYIGVQPAPGALYVPDEDAGTYAPSRQEESESPATTQWTPSQPRTDIDPDLVDLEDGDDEIEDVTDTDTDADWQDEDGIDEDADESTPPTSPTAPDDPDQTTTPTDPDQTTTPGDLDPTDDEDPDPTGSAEPAPTTVPTVTETPGPSESTPPTSATATEPTAAGPSGSLGSGPGSGSIPGSGGSHDLPFPFGSAHPQGAPPTTVQTPVS